MSTTKSTSTHTPATVKPLNTPSSSGALRIHKPACPTRMVRHLLSR